MTTLPQFSDAMRSLVEKTARRVVAINAGGRDAASGILWRAGLIVTADEALGDDDDFELLMPNGTAAAGKLAGRDPSTDIALLRVQGASDDLDPFKPAGAAEPGHLAV